MRACYDCHLPVRKQDEVEVADTEIDNGMGNRVRHRVCPDPIPDQPNHRGRKFAGVQSQLRCVDLCKDGREDLTAIKHLVELAQLGTDEARDRAVHLKLVAEDLLREIDAALDRRKELTRGK